MKKSDAINEFAAAFSLAQSLFVEIPKNKEAQLGSYSFKYADLSSIITLVRPTLAAHGLAFSQSVEIVGTDLMISTMLCHKSGQWIETTTPIKIEKPGNQGLGSAQTYGKRYALCALLGIVADDDDDGNRGDGNPVVSIKDRPKQPAGVSAIKVQINEAVREVNACADYEQLAAYLDSGPLKILAVKVCAEYPDQWIGPEPFSGLAGCIMQWGDTLEHPTEIREWIQKVEKAAKKKGAIK